MGSAASVVKQSYDFTKRQCVASKMLPKLMAFRTLEKEKNVIVIRTRVDEKNGDEKECNDVEGGDDYDQCPVEEMKMTKEEIGQIVREAQVLMDRGGEARLEQAKNLYEQVVEGREKLLGPIHANTLKSISVLGSILHKQKKLYRARLEYERALNGYKQVFGIDNKDTLNCMNSLAEVLQGLDLNDEAINIFKECLAGKERLYGDHESTFITANHLADLLKKIRRIPEARDVYVKALQGKEKILGDNHPSTINAMINLALIQTRLGNLKDAIDLYERALQGQEQLYGIRHENTITTAKGLYKLLIVRSVDRKEDAKALMKRVGLSS